MGLMLSTAFFLDYVATERRELARQNMQGQGHGSPQGQSHGTPQGQNAPHSQQPEQHK